MEIGSIMPTSIHALTWKTDRCSLHKWAGVGTGSARPSYVSLLCPPLRGHGRGGETVSALKTPSAKVYSTLTSNVVGKTEREGNGLVSEREGSFIFEMGVFGEKVGRMGSRVWVNLTHKN